MPSFTRLISVVILLLFFFSFQLKAQMNFNDIKDVQKVRFYDEQFTSSSSNWQLENKSEIINGQLLIDAGNFGPGGITNSKIAVSQIEIDETKDFEFETLISYNIKKMGIFSIILGGRYEWQLTSKGVNILGALTDKSFLASEIQESSSADDNCVMLNSKKAKIIPSESTGFKFKESQAHKFTIRKFANTLYFFINERNVGNIPFNRIYSKKIGFCVRAQEISIDYVTFYYIQKENTSDNNYLLNRSLSNNNETNTLTVMKPGKYFSLIIGVSDYDEEKLKLDNPTKDATTIKEILTTRYSFPDSTTFLVFNPTRQKIISELFKLRKLVKSEDNLLIFFAGHGYWDKEAQQGYWWPKDATLEDPSNWLSNSDLREQIRSIKSAHTLLISDACFSGGIFKTRGGDELMNAPKDIQMLYKLPSRRAMTSGTMTTVPDRSVFLEYLCKRLSENKEKFLSSQHLFDSFRAAAMNNSNTVPQDGVIADTGDEGGDFIFILKEN